MEKLKTNYVSRVRFRKVILLIEVIGFAFYLAGFATPYWVSFLSEKSKLDASRGLFATCVRTAGKLTCANIEDFPTMLLLSIAFACLAVVSYLIAVLSALLVINWTSEQRHRIVILSIVTNFSSTFLVTATMVGYMMYAKTLSGSPLVVFYLVAVSAVLSLISGLIWIFDSQLKEPKRKKRAFQIPPLATLSQRIQSPVSKVSRKAKELPEITPKPVPLFTKVLYTKPSDSNHFKFVKR